MRLLHGAAEHSPLLRPNTVADYYRKIIICRTVQCGLVQKSFLFSCPKHQCFIPFIPQQLANNYIIFLYLKKKKKAIMP